MRHIYLIRHGETAGNLEKRYVGRTDEPLCDKGRASVQSMRELCNKIPGLRKVEKVYASPLKRCQETASLLFPEAELQMVPGLREMDFGRFEYKNYQGLNGEPAYQRWIDSNGTLPFPEGESREKFADRCCLALEQIVQAEEKQQVEGKRQGNLVLVVHGGTIMAILDRYSRPHRDYYEWQIGNAEIMTGEIEVEHETMVISALHRIRIGSDVG